MVHQAVKITDEQEKIKFLDWLWDLEFQKFQLPIPDVVIFLDMPPDYTRRLIDERANKLHQNKQDIHERNQDYLTRCYNNYHTIADKYKWYKINCVHGGRLRGIDEINEEIYQTVYKLANQ
jgi:dTMP kinase